MTWYYIDTEGGERMKKRNDGRYEQSIIIDGKRKVFYGKTQREVKDKIRNYEEESEAGPPFNDIIDVWEGKQENKVSYSTMKTYKARLRQIKARFEGQRVSAITPKAINTYILHLADKEYGYKTVAGYLSLLNMLFECAMIEGHIEANPADLVRVPSGLKRTQRELPSDSDIKKIIASRERPFGLFPYFILYSGLRKGEALALTYQDIDWENREIHVTKSVYFKNKEPHLKMPKTKNSIRVVPLLDALADVLPRQDIGLVFPGPTGKHYTAPQYEHAWKVYAKETGISCTAHQLRHVLATILYEADIRDKDAQKIMGHADISTTRNIYTHIREARQKQTANKLNEFISSSDFRHKLNKCDDKAE